MKFQQSWMSRPAHQLEEAHYNRSRMEEAGGHQVLRRHFRRHPPDQQGELSVSQAQDTGDRRR